MIELSENERQRAFSMWLRTGRLPSARNADGIELKFNPWHDPENGRFTFVGAGRRDGGGTAAIGAKDGHVWPARRKPQSSASGANAKEPVRTAYPGNRAESSARKSSAPGTWGGGGFTGGGGGSFGGAGASGTWGSPEPKRRSLPLPGRATRVFAASGAAGTSKSSSGPVEAPIEQFHAVARNGYTYYIDSRERTRRVFGALTIANAPVRSKTSQSRAGGTDRRVTDDGGHYIAARFNGPTDAFNHFAQDANVNRGRYRLLEDEWAREKRAGRAVTVRIVPQFGNGSLRPSEIDVKWTVNGTRRSVKLPNERSEQRRGGR